MQIIISANNEEYVGILLREDMLVANTLPAESKSLIFDELQNYAGNSVVYIKDENHFITDILWQIWRGTSYPTADIAFDFTGYSEKERAVLQSLLKIKPGETITYGELAKMSGIPRGARFVGNVMAKNRWPLLIPCHRVVRKDGIGNYSSRKDGVKIKKRLLQQEKEYKERKYKKRV